MAALVHPYLEHVGAEFVPDAMEEAATDAEGWSEKLFEKSIFDNQMNMELLLSKASQKSFAKLKKDPVFQFIKSLRKSYFEKVAPGYGASSTRLDSLTGQYTVALRSLFPERAFFPDANSTLRLTYGKVEGSSPYDGMIYQPFTTAQGLLQKYLPGDADFDLPLGLVEALRSEDWGDYADSNGELPVCFTGSNHTTGGNSGSPAIDGDGHLVGINFDRSWESTMSDILFDGSSMPKHHG